jgi:hypothetical protein
MVDRVNITVVFCCVFLSMALEAEITLVLGFWHSQVDVHNAATAFD